MAISEVGIYKLGKSFAYVVANLIGPFETVFYPRIAVLWSEERLQVLRTELRRKGMALGIGLGLLSLVMLPLMPILVPLFAGAEYTASVGVAQLFIVFAAFAFASYWRRPLLLAMGEVTFLAIRPVFIAVAMLVGFFTIVPAFGYLGAAWVMLGANVLVGIPLTWGYTVWKFNRRLSDHPRSPVAR